MIPGYLREYPWHKMGARRLERVMKIIASPMQGAHVLNTQPFRDDRGSFARLFCRDDLAEVFGGRQLVQINHSFTRQSGTVRGLHFQFPPAAECKIVHCLVGSIFDVMVDLRAGSSTFLQWHGEVLSAENGRALFIPEGFAHGFQSLEPNCHMLYCHSASYSPEHEGAVRFDDPRLAVSWPLEPLGLSNRDRNHALLGDDFKGIKLPALDHI